MTNWKMFREEILEKARKILNEKNGVNTHDEALSVAIVHIATDKKEGGAVGLLDSIDWLTQEADLRNACFTCKSKNNKYGEGDCANCTDKDKWKPAQEAESEVPDWIDNPNANPDNEFGIPKVEPRQINPNVKEGDKIRILKMTNPGSVLRNKEPEYEGREGVIDHIDHAGQLHGTWGGCAVIPEYDSYELVE